MAALNRIGSPMDLCDESLDEEPDLIKRTKKTLEAKQHSKSPFLIGSIEEVNQKIGKLEHRLQSYTQLVVESRASDYSDFQDVPFSKAFDPKIYQQQEKEKKDVYKFAGIYSIKSAFLPNLSQRVKNINKISMRASKDKSIQSQSQVKNVSGKPKFVELHQFPGYDPLDLTPLPNGIDPRRILNVVVDASVNLDKKPRYKPEFQLLFFSTMSQSIFQDTFWFFFLQQFQPNPTTQQRFFDRVAKEYVKLLLFSKNPFYRDTFLTDYPLLLSQAIYSAYCHAFPDSYRQFGENFKNELVFLVYGWCAGIRPSPRCWLNWNFDKLDSPLVNRMANNIASTKKKGKLQSLNLNYLSSTNPSQVPSLSGSKTSSVSNLGQANVHHKLFHLDNNKSLLPGGQDKLKIQSSTSVLQNLEIATTAESVSPRLTPGDGLCKGSKALKGGVKKFIPTPKRFGEEEEEKSIKARSLISGSTRQGAVKMKPDVKESHPACKGPDFLTATFNIYGHSPLVTHFLKMCNLASTADLMVRMSRTEIETQPPMDAPTYQDVIQESSKTIHTILQQFLEKYEKNQNESAIFLKQQHLLLLEHRKRESTLLSNLQEIRRLGDLIVLEQGKGNDSLSFNAKLAVEAALMSGD